MTDPDASAAPSAFPPLPPLSADSSHPHLPPATTPTPAPVKWHHLAVAPDRADESKRRRRRVTWAIITSIASIVAAVPYAALSAWSLVEAIERGVAPWQSYATALPMFAMVTSGTVALHLWRQVLGDRAPDSAAVDWLGWLPALLVAFAVPTAFTIWYLQVPEEPVAEALRLLLIPTAGLAMAVTVAALVLAVCGAVRHTRRPRVRRNRP
jgi:hypothetical protein